MEIEVQNNSCLPSDHSNSATEIVILEINSPRIFKHPVQKSMRISILQLCLKKNIE